MIYKRIRVITLLSLASACCLAGDLPGAEVAAQDFVVIPGPTHAVQFRLYTNAVPDATHVFNTFDVEAYGTILLQSPRGDALKQRPTPSASSAVLHNIIVDDRGPELASTNSMTVIERASGPDWQYIALDVRAAYRPRLKEFSRSILFVEPDLFVLYDHLVAENPVSFQLQLHPPAAIGLDTNWGDLHLEMNKVGMTIHSPGRRRDPRRWTRVESGADAIVRSTVTMALGPTNKLSEFHVMTVFAIRRGGEKKEFAFKLVESSKAIGVQVQRNGLPTLVAFKTDPSATNASLTGFGFNGPVGVYVYRPKSNAR